MLDFANAGMVCWWSVFALGAAAAVGVRVREWALACSAPVSPLASACALHLLCRDAGFLHVQVLTPFVQMAGTATACSLGLFCPSLTRLAKTP